MITEIIRWVEFYFCFILYLFYLLRTMKNKEKYSTQKKYENEQFSQLTNSKNLVKYDAVTPARTNQSALAEITN